jgi:NAD(P)-dependent dehydrogenase (short-subunit alcohol dehydrogenase family)
LLFIFAKARIRVNAIAPGLLVIKQNEKLLFKEDGTPSPSTGKILNSTPMGRFGEPAEFAGGLLILISEQAASFETYVVLPIDGGFSSYAGV